MFCFTRWKIAVQESTLIRHGFAVPLCPFGTFPPDRGSRSSPLEGEGSGGRLIAAPTVHRKPVGAHSMRPPGFAPEYRRPQGPPLRRIWSRPRCFRRGWTLAGPREGHITGRLLSAFGRFTFSPSPTVLKKTFRNWVGEALGPPARIRTGSVGSANPGASVNRSKIKFCILRAQWGRKKTQASTPDFARRNHGSTNQESAPVKRGPGKGDYGHEVSIGAVPGAFWLLCRHGQRNSPPAGGETFLRNWGRLDGR